MTNVTLYRLQTDNTPVDQNKNAATEPEQHMWYFEFGLFSVGLVCLAVSISSLSMSVISYTRDNFTLSWENELNGGALWHGYVSLVCLKEPWPIGLPSILRLKELRAEANVGFRIAIMIPFVVRVFGAYCQYCLLLLDSRQPRLTAVFGALLTPITLVELFCASVMIMLNIRIDGLIYYKFALFLFGFFSIINMMIMTLMFLLKRNYDGPAIFSLAIKIFSLVVYLSCMPIFFRHHLSLLNSQVPCHPIVPTPYALLEYASLLSNAAFHLTGLIDLRNIRFIVITEQCECDPPVDEQLTAMGHPYLIEPAQRCTHKKKMDINETETVRNDRRMG